MKRGWFKGERVDVVVVCGTLCFCHLQPGWRRTPTAGPKAGIQHGLLQRGVGGGVGRVAVFGICTATSWRLFHSNLGRGQTQGIDKKGTLVAGKGRG